MRYVIGIDQSTQGTKALLLDENARLIARADASHKQYISGEGYISHDPEEIYQNVKIVVKDVLQKAGIHAGEVDCIGISNQRETTAAWDRRNGRPLCMAIVWQCARAERICDRFTREDAEKIVETTGIPLSPYFPAAKMRWILDNVPDAKQLEKEGNLCLGTIDSWLLFSMTHGKRFLTDCSNASRTQLMNLQELRWDPEVCEKFGIQLNCLPRICDSDACFGVTDLDGIFPAEIPVRAMLGDSHAALYAHGCHRPGTAKCTYGTGSSVMMNVGQNPVRSAHGLAASLAWRIHGQTQYVLEGNINYSGAVVTWMQDAAGWIEEASQSETCIAQADPSDTTYLVPAFSGLGAPHWNAKAKAGIVGMTRKTGRNELVRAGVESIGYQIADVIKAMEQDCGKRLTDLSTDGGATKNSYLMQFQSDICNVYVKVSEVEEMSGFGAAVLAGVAHGTYSEASVFSNMRYRRYDPVMDEEHRNIKYDGWKNAVLTVTGHVAKTAN